jgi:uncharacterized protein (DUF608 family)
MGGLLTLYRDWQIYGDDAWLKQLWPRARQALEYAWQYWDRDKDGVMEGVQHNTYDIEFYGPNTMLGSYYLGALRAAEEMATYLGDLDKAAEYHALYESGRLKMDATLFNGEYYVQDVRLEAQAQASHDPSLSIGGQSIDPGNPRYPKYQYGTGCLADQLIGQWYARMLQLGDLFDPDHIRKALASIFKYNWKSDLSEHANPQRIYAMGDEAGLLLATWPTGGRPALPFVYSDEVWPGIEYQVASHLIYEGFVEEGLAIVKGVRDRHTGVRRNPWNEFECGSHYARSLASYSLLLALSGFFYSAPAKALTFRPRVYEGDFSCFFSVDSGWGIVRQVIEGEMQRVVVEVNAGSLALRTLRSGFKAGNPQATLGGVSLPVSAQVAADGTLFSFDGLLTIREGASLVVSSRAGL